MHAACYGCCNDAMLTYIEFIQKTKSHKKKIVLSYYIIGLHYYIIILIIYSWVESDLEYLNSLTSTVEEIGLFNRQCSPEKNRYIFKPQP